jgi:hypothetical protein
MREFFRGWRRKFGIGILAIACVFVVGWTRSLSVADEVNIPYRSALYSLKFRKGEIDYRRIERISTKEERVMTPIGVRTIELKPIDHDFVKDSDHFGSRNPRTIDDFFHDYIEFVNWSERPSPNWASDKLLAEKLNDLVTFPKKSQWKFCGIEYAAKLREYDGSNLVSVLFLVIPHWSIVVPLMLLSAYLLLSKPKPKPRPTTSEQPSV